MRTIERTIEVETAIQELPPVDPEQDGMKAVEEKQSKVAAMRQEIDDIKKEGLAAIKAIREEYEQMLIDHYTPKGDDLANHDYLLLQDKLVNNPMELKAIAAKHDNVTFWRAVKSYADMKHWQGFDDPLREFEAKMNAMRDFSKFFFDLCETAAKYTRGYAAMQVANENEITRLAMNYVVLDCLTD